MGGEDARRSLLFGVRRESGKGAGVWLSAWRSRVAGAGGRERAGVRNDIHDGGCSTGLPKSDGDKAGGSVDSPNVSSAARGLSSSEYESVSSSNPSGSIADPKRFFARVGGGEGKKNGGGGVSASGDGSNVRVAENY